MKTMELSSASAALLLVTFLTLCCIIPALQPSASTAIASSTISLGKRYLHPRCVRSLRSARSRRRPLLAGISRTAAASMSASLLASTASVRAYSVELQAASDFSDSDDEGGDFEFGIDRPSRGKADIDDDVDEFEFVDIDDDDDDDEEEEEEDDDDDDDEEEENFAKPTQKKSKSKSKNAAKSKAIISAGDDDNDDDHDDPDAVGYNWKSRRQKLLLNNDEDDSSGSIRLPGSVAAAGRLQRRKKRITWEDQYSEDPLKADSPTVDLPWPEPSTYKKLFVAYAFVNDDATRQKRSEFWIQHMQWVRRSALLPDDAGSDMIQVKVTDEYTLLSDDCIRPVGQVLFMQANSSAAVRAYLAKEPLAAVGGISIIPSSSSGSSSTRSNTEQGPSLSGAVAGRGWVLCEAEQVLSPDDSGDEFASEESMLLRTSLLTNDLRDPYLQLLLFPSPSPSPSKAAGVTSKKTKTKVQDKGNDKELATALQRSAEYLAGWDPLNQRVIEGADTWRTAQYCTLWSTDPSQTTTTRSTGVEKEEEEGKEGERRCMGRVLLFNAASNSDAERFLSADPATLLLASSSSVEIGNKKANAASTTRTTTAATSAGEEKEGIVCVYKYPVNVQDVSGLHHVMARSFGEQSELDQIHFMDPEDLLVSDFSASDAGEVGLSEPGFRAHEIPGLEGHQEENDAVLQMLQERQISYRYTRLKLTDKFRLHPSVVALEKELAEAQKAELAQAEMQLQQANLALEELLEQFPEEKDVEEEEIEEEFYGDDDVDDDDRADDDREGEGEKRVRQRVRELKRQQRAAAEAVAALSVERKTPSQGLADELARENELTSQLQAIRLMAPSSTEAGGAGVGGMGMDEEALFMESDE